MENIYIKTTQNVELNYQPAGLGLRILSIFLDNLFKYSYLFILIIIFYNLLQHSGGFDSIGNNITIITILVILLFPFFLYHLLCETFLNGQSFGKKIMKIKVVKLDGTQPNFGSYLIRSMFRFLDDGIIGVITIAVSKNAQRVGDLVAGTTVIQLNRKMEIYDTILSQQVENYKIVYSQISLMSDKDMSTIREVLEFAESQDQPQHLNLLATKIKTKYGIFDVKQNDADFLNTILKDYTHYQFEN